MSTYFGFSPVRDCLPIWQVLLVVTTPQHKLYIMKLKVNMCQCIHVGLTSPWRSYCDIVRRLILPVRFMCGQSAASGGRAASVTGVPPARCATTHDHNTTFNVILTSYIF